MSITFHDLATIAGTHRTADRYLAANARVARTGIQIYTGAEAGRPSMSSVRVYRSPAAVFDNAARASAAHKPITMGHPTTDVTADNWKTHSVGWTGDTIAIEGDHLRVPMMLADQAAIDAVQSGIRELSCGYTCDLDWTPGTTPEGQAYDAQQKSIRINHVALVAAGRAGSLARFGDSASLTLRDAAGVPITLYDERTGGTMKLNSDLIAAIENEAAKLGMSVHEYVQHVLKYSWAGANLSGNANTGSPAAKEIR